MIVTKVDLYSPSLAAYIPNGHFQQILIQSLSRLIEDSQ